MYLHYHGMMANRMLLHQQLHKQLLPYMAEMTGATYTNYSWTHARGAAILRAFIDHFIRFADFFHQG